MADMFTESGAWFSDEDPPLYRYDMWRRWGPGPMLTFVMLNPSTGSPDKFDATNTRCERRAIRLRYDGVRFLNLCAYRTPYPKALKAADKAGIDVVGPNNWDAIRAAAMETGEVVCAWGRDRAFKNRAAVVVPLLQDLGCRLTAIKLLSDGTPMHPIARGRGAYMPYDLPLIPMEPARG